MSQLPWLDGYAGQTTDGLIALEGIYRTDSLVLAFEQAIGQKAARIGDAQLTTPERVVLAIEALEREVNNDGYVGLFTNVSDQVPYLVSSLTAIGTDAVADLIRSALALLKIEGPFTPEAVESAIWREDDDRNDRLHELDQAYYETTKLFIGTRVRVRRDPTFLGPWPADPLGTIIPWPAELAAIDPSIAGGELFRIVEHQSVPERYRGLQRVYFVEFDEPQFDTDGPEGGGPHRKASVRERYLDPIEVD